MGKNKFAPLFALIIVILCSFVYAQEYYADLSVDVHDDGLVKIVGITNNPDFFPGTYQEFTSKKGKYWLLNMSSEKEFSDYIIEVTLPDGAEFNYFKASGRPRITYDGGIKIITSGTGSLSLVVQYSINSRSRSLMWLWIVSFFAAVAGLFLFLKLRKRDEAKGDKNKKISEKKENLDKKGNLKEDRDISEKKEEYEKIMIIKKTLAESQEKIIDLLLDAGGELIQKQLQHRSGLPKATLSRNIDVLSKKGLIVKQSRGMTNMIMLNRNFSSK